MRPSGRAPDELRNIRLTRRYTKHAEGSVLVEFGETRVLCNATVENRVPPFLKGTSKGWITAEYGMLPRSTACSCLEALPMSSLIFQSDSSNRKIALLNLLEINPGLTPGFAAKLSCWSY